MNNAPTSIGMGMMDGMGGMLMWGMGLVWLLVIVLLFLHVGTFFVVTQLRHVNTRDVIIVLVA